MSAAGALRASALELAPETRGAPGERTTKGYSVLGVRVAVTADDPGAVELVDDTYAAFRSRPESGDGALALGLRRTGEEEYLVTDSDGYERRWSSRPHAVGDLLARFMLGVLARATRRGVYAIHAGAVEYGGRAAVFSGRSGAGKTTLVLNLLQRGFRLLSDELAIVEPSTQRILPYPRSLHIRPGTPDLIRALRPVQRASETLVRGAWTLTPDVLEEALPGSLAPAAQLTNVVLLEGTPDAGATSALTPIAPAVAALELLRATWAASVAFDAGLGRVSRLLEGVSCARLRVGDLEATTDVVAAWLRESRA